MTEQPQAGPSIPHNLEAEEAVIGAVLIDGESFPELLPILDADDFYIHRHRWIWDSFFYLFKTKTAIDLVTVQTELERRSKLAEIGGPAYLTGLVYKVPTSLNAASYAELVARDAFRRRLLATANAIASLAYDQKNTIERIRDEAWKSLETVSLKDQRSRGLTGLDTFIATVYDQADKWSQTEELPGVPTGFIDLDRLLSNLQPEDLIIVAGRPSQGKTALLTDIAYSNGAPKHGPSKTVAIFSLEMSGESVATRILSKETGIDSQTIRTGKLLPAEWPLLTGAVERLGESGIYIDPTGGITPLQILTRSRAIKARRGLDLIIVDYLQLSEGEGDNRTQEVGYVSRSLKKIAKELKVPVVAAAQMNRSVENRSNKRPVLSDLRESGEIEQDADVVIFIYHPEDRVNVTELIVAKQRNGPLGTVELIFQKALAKFENATTRTISLNEPAPALTAPGEVEAAWMNHENTGGGTTD